MPVLLRPVFVFEKYTGESMKQAVDFANVLDAGETVTGGGATAKRLDTGASAPEVLTGSPTVVGNTVVYQVTGGTVGISYVIQVSATLSSAETYMQMVRMDVVDLP